MGWIMATVTSPETWLAPGALFTTMLCVYGRKKGAAAVVAALLSVAAGDMLAHYVIKPAVGRHRPCAELEGVHQPSQVGCTDSFSFPSNHAVNTFALTAAVGVIYPRLLIVLAPLALLVALSRVAVGVHYPADVATGAVLGIIVGAGAAVIVTRYGISIRKNEARTDG